jgi:hypothetical protein
MNSTEFRSLCSSWRSDFDGFARVVASALELGLSRRELALTFRVPESWIKAWANGGAPPHPLAQEGCDRAIPNPNLLIKSFAYKIKHLLKNIVLLYSPGFYANALDAGL